MRWGREGWGGWGGVWWRVGHGGEKRVAVRRKETRNKNELNTKRKEDRRMKE